MGSPFSFPRSGIAIAAGSVIGREFEFLIY